MFNDINGIPDYPFMSPEALVDYFSNISAAHYDGLSGYGREVHHLCTNGYLFNVTTKYFVK